MKLSQLEQLEMKLKKMKNSTLIPLIITLLCATQTSYANDAVVAKNISANSLKQLDRSTAGKYGEYGFKYDIDASPDTAVTSTEGNKCCATVATKESTVKCRIINKGGWYIVWTNYSSACCVNGRREWVKVKDLLKPHETRHKTTNENINKEEAPITISVLKAVSKKKCAQSAEEAKELAKKACEQELADRMNDFRSLCNATHEAIDAEDVKPTNINACSCNI